MNEEQKKDQNEEMTENFKKDDFRGLLDDFEAMLDEYMVKKAPFSLPSDVKDFIVKVTPYVIIVFAVLAIPTVLIALGISTVAAPFAMMGWKVAGSGWGIGSIISLIAMIAVVIMEIMAVPGLFKRTKGSWRLLFYASIVSLIGSIFSIVGIFSGIIGAIISWYILFQVKSLYKN